MKSDKQHGSGTWTYTNGKITGQFKNSKREGFGICSWSDGTLYAGEWSDGERNGKGIFFNTDDKSTYEGD